MLAWFGADRARLGWAGVPLGVVIPVHGFSPYLAQTLDAVLAQSEPAVDVVVVDDGSPRPLQLAPGHAERVRVVRLEQSGGPGGARNAGVAALADEVDYVAFCDHDDVWSPEHLAAHRRAIGRNPSASIFAGDTRFVGPDDLPVDERMAGLHHGPHRWFLVLPTVYERHPLSTSATVVRRTSFDAVGGFDADLRHAEDLDLWLRLLERESELVAVLGAEVRRRRHPGGLTHDLVQQAAGMLRVHREHAEHVRAPVARRAEASDLRALGTGLARRGAYPAALDAYARADELIRPRPAERLRQVAVRFPGLRSCVGRRAVFGR